jgi:hypothetical protein
MKNNKDVDAWRLGWINKNAAINLSLDTITDKEELKKYIIEQRKSFLCIDQARRCQKILMDIYQDEYVPKHKAKEHLKAILDYGVDGIEESSPQMTENHPDTVFQTFSVVSQHVWGYTKEHCLDQICDAIQRKIKRIAYYKTLPTIQQLVSSNIKIKPHKTYYFKDQTDPEDSCAGYSGDIIIEMREIGIDEYRYKSMVEQTKWLMGDR